MAVKHPQKVFRFKPSLKFLSVFSAVCRKGGGPGGLESTHPCPTFAFSLPNVSIPLLCLFFPLSSPGIALLHRPFCLHSPSSLKRAPRPSEFERVTQTLHCLTSTSCSCLGGGGVGWWSPRVLKAAGFKVWNRTDLKTWVQIWWQSEGRVEKKSDGLQLQQDYSC